MEHARVVAVVHLAAQVLGLALFFAGVHMLFGLGWTLLASGLLVFVGSFLAEWRTGTLGDAGRVPADLSTLHLRTKGGDI